MHSNRAAGLDVRLDQPCAVVAPPDRSLLLCSCAGTTHSLRHAWPGGWTSRDGRGFGGASSDDGDRREGRAQAAPGAHAAGRRRLAHHERAGFHELGGPRSGPCSFDESRARGLTPPALIGASVFGAIGISFTFGGGFSLAKTKRTADSPMRKEHRVGAVALGIGVFAVSHALLGLTRYMSAGFCAS